MRLLPSLFLLAGVPASAQPSAGADPASASPPPSHRPRVCLVLSGGGARGYAHLGVLQYLEKLHVPVDCIAGTSMGALIGGLYASGLSAEELERRLAATNLSDIAFDRNDRARLPQSQREDEYQYPISISAGYDDGKLKLAPGLVQGNNLLTLLQNWTARLPANIDFSRLPIPFRAVATDLSLGTKVEMTEGSLPRAMRASMAVPGLFAPFRVGSRTLVDGGLVSNLPVQTAREMGADVIIAVNIATPLQDAAALQSPTAVAQQMVGILIQQNVQAQKALLGSGDVLIEPQLEGVSFTDFARGKDGINAGWDAAQRQNVRLTELSLPPQRWQAYLAERARNGSALAEGTRIDAIEVRSGKHIPTDYVRGKLKAKPGDVYDGAELNRELSTLSANGDFNGVTQELITREGRNVLVVDAEEKSWGPQYLLFGLGLSNSFNGRGGYNLQIGHRYPWINASGLEWRNDLVLGNTRLSLQSELRQPIWGSTGAYIAPYVELSRRYLDLYADGSDVKASPLNEYRLDSAIAGVDLGLPLARLGELRVGLNYRHQRYAPNYDYPIDSGGTVFPSGSSNQPSARIRLTIDQLDDVLFPRKGYYAYAEANHGFGGSDNRYSDVQAKVLWAFGSGLNTVNVALEGARSLSSNETSLGSNGIGFTLGGFQRLSAYAPDQFAGNYLLYGRLTWLRDLNQYSLAGLRNPVLGTSLEVGNVWQSKDNFGDGPYKTSASVFLGGNSPVGPIYFGVALGQRGMWNLYMQLGRVF
ncbi:patatin-like phospholipase family protein [Herbaspirillum sp. LeCh32-8]|uniref:patatin-like phospholipase family protein n=1 Tax=Herbaspirillum sp. LeCh32-8 TaxID=2821356 RepID=UPI001FD72D73|nr:patatin-like phospholipase family protein [Herbaspirillum sp. LeCh32-8]